MSANAIVKPEGGGAVAPASPNEDAWLSMIERAARDPSIDVSKMERMFDMRERVMKASAEQAFNAAFVAVKAAGDTIKRNKKNNQTDSKYADLAAIADGLDDLMTSNGFAATFGTADCPTAGHYRVTGTLLHADGHSRDYHMDIPIDAAGLKGNANKTATHAFGSTMTYGRRYLKVAMFDLVTADDDGNAGGARKPDNRGFSTGGSANAVRDQVREDMREGREPGLEVENPKRDPLWKRLSDELAAAEFTTKDECKNWLWHKKQKGNAYAGKHHTWRKAFYEEIYKPLEDGLPEAPK